MHEVSIPVENRRIIGRLFEPEPSGSVNTGQHSRAGLLFVHGLDSSQGGYTTRAKAASSELGLTCLTFDLGGHGGSTGDRDRLSRSDHLQDLEAAYDRLRSAPDVNPARIGVCGASYGAYLTCLLIGTRQIRRLLLRAPALYRDQDTKIPPDERGEPFSDSIALRNLHAFDGETLVLESGADEIIPHSVIETYLAASKRPVHHVIEGARHRLYQEEWNAAFIREILVWFKNL
jgi:hypothetical protein